MLGNKLDLRAVRCMHKPQQQQRRGGCERSSHGSSGKVIRKTALIA